MGLPTFEVIDRTLDSHDRPNIAALCKRSEYSSIHSLISLLLSHASVLQVPLPILNPHAHLRRKGRSAFDTFKAVQRRNERSAVNAFKDIQAYRLSLVISISIQR
jgi:hypothetical protein